ncbi:MAG: S4 domain-containing protein, partial [Pseudobdellovibrionaceae bacterium]
LMLRYYELLTDISVSDLEKLKTYLKECKKHPRDVKVQLAKFLITRFHSASAAQAAEDEFNRVFVQKGLPDEVPELGMKPGEPIWICHLLVHASLAPSTSEARRLIQGAAVEVDGEKISDPQLKIELQEGKAFILKAGKKKFAKIVVRT